MHLYACEAEGIATPRRETRDLKTQKTVYHLALVRKRDRCGKWENLLKGQLQHIQEARCHFLAIIYRIPQSKLFISSNTLQ